MARFGFDSNDGCFTDHKCNYTINALIGTWERITNVMNFDWSMNIGNMLANFNYLLDVCSNKYKLQIEEKMWAPTSESFRGQCKLDDDAKALYKDIETITEGTFDFPAEGLYLNDFIAFMGYSTTFDISSLSKEKYLSTTRNLHPVYSMDRWQDVIEWKVEKTSKKQCNYLGTYRKWVQLTIKRQKGNLGTILITISVANVKLK